MQIKKMQKTKKIIKLTVIMSLIVLMMAGCGVNAAPLEVEKEIKTVQEHESNTIPEIETEPTQEETQEPTELTETTQATEPVHIHEFIKSSVIAPTCEKPGYTLEKCKCGATRLVDMVETSGHEWGNWIIIKRPSKTMDGERKRVCSICQKEEREVMKATSCQHKYEKTIVDPTCEGRGYTIYKCTLCGDEYTDHYTPALGHDFEMVVTKEPTCDKSGECVYKCTRDGCKKTKEESIPPLGHDYKEIVLEKPTCEKGGQIKYECQRNGCGHAYVKNTLSLKHHWSDWETIKDATEESEGLKERHCLNDGCHEKQKMEIPKKEHIHDYKAVVTKPTCISKGYTTYTCKCGDSYQGDIQNPLGHIWGKWIVDVESTEESTGHRYAKCTRPGCNQIKEETLPVKEHVCKYEKTVIEPTCQSKGYTHYYCPKCGNEYDSDYTDPTPHNWTDWETVKEPSIESEGLKKRHCQNEGCTAEESESIEKLPDPATHDHTWEVESESVIHDYGAVVKVQQNLKCPGCGATDSKEIKKESASYAQEVKDDLFNLTNELRTENGLEPFVQANSDWQDWADMRAKELDERFSHTRPNGDTWMTSIGDEYNYAENVAYNWWEYDIDGAEFYKMYEGSAGHKANMLINAPAMAVGVYINPENGKIYTSMIMVRYRNENYNDFSPSDYYNY